MDKRWNKNYTVYSGHFLKGMGNTAIINKAGLV